MAKSLEITAETVELDATDGMAFIEQASPLTRLHYFDGKFLRADALALEQDYHRHRVRLSNIAGGWGAVHGFAIARSGNRLDIGAGLAITAAGNFVLATADFSAQIDDLLKVAAPPPPTGSPAFADCLGKAKAGGVTETNGLAIYEITVGPVEGLCGNEPVYGKLCESACATDSRHPYYREGVVLRLRPVSLQLPMSAAVKPALAHLRNRIASAYFAAEPWLTESIVSGAGLASHVWCEPATLYGRDEVVIGLLAREGGVTRVLDAWSGRRERMDTQARGYWQGRMSMRPWNVFVAQILQFQCQLSGLFESGKPVFEGEDDCDQLRALLERTRKQVDGLLKRYGDSAKKIKEREEGKRPTVGEFRSLTNDMSSSYSDLDDIAGLLADAELGKGALPKQRMLLGAGFFELPPAGYLPVDPQVEIEEQVQRMFGEGAKLHFHAVRHDEIAHLVEEAQHMERISLTRGLDNPKNVEQVEIFVPDGEVRGADAAGTGTWWSLDMAEDATNALSAAASGEAYTPKGKSGGYEGLVRTEGREDGSYGFALAAAGDSLQANIGKANLRDFSEGARRSIYLSGDIAADPFGLGLGDETTIKVEFKGDYGGMQSDLKSSGSLTVLKKRSLDSGLEERLVQIDIPLEKSGESRTMKVILQRDGDAKTGIFIVDDEKSAAASSPAYFDWDDTPRRAGMFVNAGYRAGVLINLMGGEAKRAGTPAEGGPANLADGANDKAEADALKGGRQQLLDMTGLATMPQPTSTIGAMAMNILVQLAEHFDDAALLARARKRLFPALDAPKTQTVRATRDWVMFRRARTHLCGPACETPPAAGVESFLVWHLQVDAKTDLAKLKAALDNGNENALAGFKFKRVGVLRYRDESAFPEESADSVVQMWKDAKPAPQVVLGRVWESAPSTGQGWQNHFRLRNMLEQIADLTKPASSTGVVAAIPAPAKSLEDGALDGGMLVVTIGKAVEEKPHRVVMVPIGVYRKLLEEFKKDTKAAMVDLTGFVEKQPNENVDLYLHYDAAGQLTATEASALTAGAGKMSTGSADFGFLARLLRIDASKVDDPTKAGKEHKDIGGRLGNFDDSAGAVTADQADLGKGAQVLTLVAFEPINEKG